MNRTIQIHPQTILRVHQGWYSTCVIRRHQWKLRDAFSNGNLATLSHVHSRHPFHGWLTDDGFSNLLFDLLLVHHGQLRQLRDSSVGLLACFWHHINRLAIISSMLIYIHDTICGQCCLYPAIGFQGIFYAQVQGKQGSGSDDALSLGGINPLEAQSSLR